MGHITFQTGSADGLDGLVFLTKSMFIIGTFFIKNLWFNFSCFVLLQDFWVMFLHHIATVILIAFSYSINMLNIGMLITNLHDFSDIFLEVRNNSSYVYGGHRVSFPPFLF